MNFKPESELLAFVEDGELVVLTRKHAIAQARAIARKALGDNPPSLVDELIRTRREEARREN